MSDKWVLPLTNNLTTQYEVIISKTLLKGGWKQAIASVECSFSDEQAKLARITVNDVGMAYLNNPYLVGKNMPVVIKMGYEGNCIEVFNGAVTHIETTFDESGIPVVVIGATETGDLIYKLHTREFKNALRSDIAKKLASEMGFKFVGAKTSEKSDIKQDGESNPKLLIRLADEEGLICFIDRVTKTVFFGSRFEPFNKVPHSIDYGFGNFMMKKFSPQLVYKNRSVTVESKKDAEKGKTEQAKAGDKSPTTPTKEPLTIKIDGVNGRSNT